MRSKRRTLPAQPIAWPRPARAMSCCTRSPPLVHARSRSNVHSVGTPHGERRAIHGSELQVLRRLTRSSARARIRRVCERGEVKTVFQPLIRLESNECIAYEALSRFPDDVEWTTSEWF